MRYELARGLLDPGLFTDHEREMERFYGATLGLRCLEHLRHSPSYQEIFFEVPPGKLKLQSFAEPMPGPATTGYRELWLPRDGLRAPQRHRDPDGLVVSLVPRGYRGVTHAGVVCAVADPERQHRFLVEGLGARATDGGLRVGDTQLVLEHDPDAKPAGPTQRRGFVYLTLIVHDCFAAHDALLAAGAEHSARVLRLADRCLFSWVRDPGGNWIECVQYAELSGPLPDVARLADHWDEVARWREHGTPY